MTEHEKNMITMIQLLREEVDALRSLFSEWDEDKTYYIQYSRAEALHAAYLETSNQLQELRKSYRTYYGSFARCHLNTGA